MARGPEIPFDTLARLFGQIQALQTLVFTLADVAADGPTFKADAMDALDRLKASFRAASAPDAMLEGVAACEDQLLDSM